MNSKLSNGPEGVASNRSRCLAVTCKRCGALPASQEEREHVYQDLFCYACSKQQEVDVDD